MEALVLLKIKPDQVLQFSHELSNADEYKEIARACFLHGHFDCALEVHAPSKIGLDEIAARIKEMVGVDEILSCTVVHTWARNEVDRVS